MKNTCGKLHVLSLGLALGTVWGLLTFITGLLAMTGYAVAVVELFNSVYIGYAPTFWGSVLGLLWGFADGFIFGVLIAFFYNWFYRCCCKTCETDEKND